MQELAVATCMPARLICIDRRVINEPSLHVSSVFHLFLRVQQQINHNSVNSHIHLRENEILQKFLHPFEMEFPEREVGVMRFISIVDPLLLLTHLFLYLFLLFLVFLHLRPGFLLLFLVDLKNHLFCLFLSILQIILVTGVCFSEVLDVVCLIHR